MKTIAQELAPRGIRVNGLAPGVTRTPINTGAWSTPEAHEALMRLVPYKRIGEPEDVARAAVWLASDDSDYVNGVTLFVDGRMTLYPVFAFGSEPTWPSLDLTLAETWDHGAMSEVLPLPALDLRSIEMTTGH